MKKLLKIVLKNTLLLYIFTVLFDAITYTLCFTATGIIRSDIFNKVQGLKTFVHVGIVPMVLLATLLPLSINITKQLDGFLFSTAQKNINNNLKRYIFNKLNYVPLSENLKEMSGEIIIRFRDDVEDIVNFFTEIYNQIPKLMMSVVNLIVMFSVNRVFTTIVVLPVLVVIFTIHFIQERLVKNKRLAREATDRATQFLGDIFNSLDAIKLSDKTDNYLEHYKELCETRGKYSVRDTVLQKFLSVFSLNLMFLALAVILFFTYDAIHKGVFTIGNFILFEYYFWFMTDLPNSFSSIYSKYKQMSVAKQRILSYDSISQTQHAINSVKDDIEGAIINGKCRVHKNEVCIIKGGNGSGKSTLLKYIFSNKEDSISWLNKKGHKIDAKVIPNQMCFLSQNTHLISGTIKSNICMSLEYDEKKMNQILDFVNLSEEFRTGKLNLESIVGEGGEQLSGGQMKRMALARLLYREPEVLLLDDVTSGLDIVTEKKVIDNLHNLKNKIVIIVSNNNQLDAYGDCIITL